MRCGGGGGLVGVFCDFRPLVVLKLELGIIDVLEDLFLVPAHVIPQIFQAD